MKNLIDILDLSTAEIDEMIAVANNIIEHPVVSSMASIVPVIG